MNNKELGGVLGRIPSGLFIVSLRTGNVEIGMLASWVQQCSFSPPLITLAVQRQRDINSQLTADARFAISIIKEGQNELIGHFSRGFAENENPFDKLDVDRDSASAPVVKSALGFLDCKVTDRMAAGDHDLIVAEVGGGGLLQDGQPWVHVRKSGFRY